MLWIFDIYFAVSVDFVFISSPADETALIYFFLSWLNKMLLFL